MNWHNIDPILPMLAHAFDSSAAMHHFAGRTAAGGSHAPFTHCRRQSVNYVPTKRCTATYLLSQEAAAWQTIGVVEVLPDRVEHRLFTDDPRLANLATAMDTRTLSTQYAAEYAGLGQIDGVTPVRYKPGSRCTLRYQTHSESGAGFCFGKLLAQDSAEIAQAVDDLFRASQTTPALPSVAQPLAYWPELQMVVQAAVSGQELHDLAFDAQKDVALRLNLLHAAGRASAALHRSEIVVPGAQKTLVGDLALLEEHKPALRQINPPLANRFDETLGLLHERSQEQEELTAVVSHGALRTDQFMVEGGRLVLIDLDSLCWSSPARDLGNFLAYLSWKSLRQPQHALFIGLGQAAFLEGYQSLRALPNARWLAHYTAASMLKILGRRYSGLTHREWPLTESLLDMAVALIHS